MHVGVYLRVFLRFQSVCTYFDDRADASRYEDKQAGLLVKQIEENHYCAETSPEHWKTKHTNIKCYIGTALPGLLLTTHLVQI